MGEVGANSSGSPHVEFKMNGGVNGSCDDERMDIDASNSSDVPTVAPTKDDAIGKSTHMDIRDNETIANANSMDIEMQQSVNDIDTSICIDGDNNKTGGDDTKTNANASSPNECSAGTKSSENGTTTTGARDVKNKASEAIANTDEVHAISDSDDDDTEEPFTNSLATSVQNASDTYKSNGVNNSASKNAGDSVDVDDDDEEDEDDGDRAVSIHSSDSEDENEPSKKNDDEEDCVVIEDDKKVDSPSKPLNRSRKSAVRPRDYDDDIEEIIDDPLETSSKKPRLMDPLNMSSESQQMLLGGNRKEPTLTIVDTNTILSRGSLTNVHPLNKQNVSMMSMGMQPHGMTYPNSSPNAAAQFSNISQMPILSALTDDMFVLEAPSFIVPYIYEKPATDNLQSLIDKVAAAIAEAEKGQEKTKPKSDKEDDGNANNVSIHICIGILEYWILDIRLLNF